MATRDAIDTEPANLHDVTLMCTSCKCPTVHSFSHRQKINPRVVDLIYECTRCNASRVYGREHA